MKEKIKNGLRTNEKGTKGTEIEREKFKTNKDGKRKVQKELRMKWKRKKGIKKELEKQKGRE